MIALDIHSDLYTTALQSQTHVQYYEIMKSYIMYTCKHAHTHAYAHVDTYTDASSMYTTDS